jgi:hypothetical protein
VVRGNPSFQIIASSSALEDARKVAVCGVGNVEMKPRPERTCDTRGYRSAEGEGDAGCFTLPDRLLPSWAMEADSSPAHPRSEPEDRGEQTVRGLGDVAALSSKLCVRLRTHCKHCNKTMLSCGDLTLGRVV